MINLSALLNQKEKLNKTEEYELLIKPESEHVIEMSTFAFNMIPVITQKIYHKMEINQEDICNTKSKLRKVTLPIIKVKQEKNNIFNDTKNKLRKVDTPVDK